MNEYIENELSDLSDPLSDETPIVKITTVKQLNELNTLKKIWS